jgi:hypothetical protein
MCGSPDTTDFLPHSCTDTHAHARVYQGVTRVTRLDSINFTMSSTQCSWVRLEMVCHDTGTSMPNTTTAAAPTRLHSRSCRRSPS